MLDVKRREFIALGILRELVPTGALIAVLLNPTLAPAEAQLKDVQAAAHAVGQQIHILHASNEPELDTALAAVAKVPAAALLVGADPFFLKRADRFPPFWPAGGIDE
jgi:hypothetical protein